MAHDQTLVQIRERGFLDLLDLALLVVRDRPVTLGVAAVVGIAPFAALNAWLMSLEPDTPPVVIIYLYLLEAPWATAPLTIVLGGVMFGDRPTIGRMLRTFLRSIPALFLFQFVLRALLMVTFLLYLVIPARLAFMNEVILLERQRWPVVRRCSILADRRGGDLFAQWLAQLVFGGLFMLAFWLGTGAIAQALVENSITWEEPGWGELGGVRFQLGVWIAIAFFAVARFLTYLDQRIRLEGWEVELRLRAVGRSLGEGRDS